MKMKRSVLVFSLFAALLMLPMAAMADSITPDTVEATIAVGETITIAKTVTINLEPPPDAQLDVLFMFDTTGSMGGLIGAAKIKAAEILDGLDSAYGDVAFAVANYEDFPVYPYGASTDLPYEKVQEMTTNADDAEAAINSLMLGSGADGPESQLYALATAATDVEWRAGSTKVAVWFGDYEGHDGDLEPSYPDRTGLADTIAALTGKGITVHAIDLSRMNFTGQATEITDATGGLLTSGAVTADTIVDTILDSVEATFDKYSTVALDLSEVPAGLSATVAPVDYTGDYSREETRTFDFTLSITGDAAGTYEFPVYATVDGGRVAKELDRITVGTPEPASMLLLGVSLLGLFGLRRKFN